MTRGGAVRDLERRIGRLYLAACAVVFLITACSFLVIQHARALGEAEAACANIARLALTEMSSGGTDAVLSLMEGDGMAECSVRIVKSDGTVLVSVGESRPWDVVVGIQGTSADGTPLSAEVSYRRPAAVSAGDAALFAAAAAVAAAFAFATRGPLVRRATGPVDEALARQREFIAAASHELKSPLSVITLDLEAISTSPANPGRVAELAREGMAECRRTADLVEDLLALAAGDAAGWTLNRVRCDAAAIFVDAFEQIESKAAAAGTAVTPSLPEEEREIVVDADPAKVAQALRAVLENALDHAPKGTPVGFSLIARPGQAAFSVSDEGAGVPDELKERIFERFYRADPSRGSRAHHGLGLSIAREIAEAHGGSLRALDNPGGGAVFELTIPLARQDLGTWTA
ncbi:hypothetical protein C1878_00085 [Gordonibacter sp. 28C]|uniref:sensor histidine kinase n=1 Tax=Gordonibacter sp. 28C TaxID=2078569 RepID=UPI000DF83DCA|nr:HAMP domain-containing sensor histidine kinase [Gordonibacter sp. 28C]RDB64305.1 hypothetical protein C1878_00085 [Gordonibacter sp. 28C]